MGKYTEALKTHFKVEIMQTDILGMNHLTTLDTKRIITTCLSNIAKYNEALEIYYQVEKMKTDILGMNHPSTLDTKHSIANIFNELKRREIKS